MTTETQDKFIGWAPTANNKQGAIDLGKVEYEPKVWDEDDVEVKVMYCGLCGSDSHILNGNWGPLVDGVTYVCGHELVGEIVKVGSAVKNRQVGDYVGVGSQADSCGECEFCKSGNEIVCSGFTASIPGFGNQPFHRGRAGEAKSLPKGGFANYWRGPAKFAIPVPKGMDLASAAPMFCGGITMYSPLERFEAGTKAKRVGVVGIGGLGHYGILFAKAMGAEVTAISRNKDKEEDAKKLGADHYIAMSEGVDAHKASLDLILCTIAPRNFDAAPYLELLRPFGQFVSIGPLPEPLALPSMMMISRNISVSGSMIGSPGQIERMLKLAHERKIDTWFQKKKFEDINIAFAEFEAGKPRYRFVLVNEENGGKL